MQGFGTGGAPGNQFDDTVRQAWTAWSNLMRGAGVAPPPAAAPAWPDATAWWAQMTGATPPAPEHPAEALLRGLRDQAGGWYSQMQRLAGQFAGRDASAAEVASAWKQLLGGQAAQAFTDVFASMSRPGMQGTEQWLAQIQPFLRAMQSMQAPVDVRSWMGLPTFGFAREHQARWQQLALAQIEYQDRSRAFAELMNEAAQQAFVAFERKLGERSAPGQQIESTRALFDLWVDAAEEAYAEIALSPRFREAYGALVDSQMRLRAAIQREIELMGELLGTPTRTEVDAAHRKIVQLEREVRRLRDAIDGLRSTPPTGGDADAAKRAAADASGRDDVAPAASSAKADANADAPKRAKSAKPAPVAATPTNAGKNTRRKPAATGNKTGRAR